MWQALMIIGGTLSVLMLFYLASRFHKFSFIRRIGDKSRLLSWVIAFIPMAILCLFALINIPTLFIVLIHFGLAFALCDLVFLIIRKTTGRRYDYNIQGSIAVAITVIYLLIGWIMAHHVFVTRYSFQTNKDLGGNLRIVEIADSHLGITLSGEDFADQMQRVQNENPDLVVIVGDFVDDDCILEDMVVACKALGNLKTTYGVYYVFGNHDRGYFNSRAFSIARLRKELEDNNVTILEDQSVLIDGRFYIVGRRDRSTRDRSDIFRLTENLDKSKYTIVLNHQPNDYDNEAKANVDLVLSGHTHGGHIFPGGIIGLLSGSNDKEYGAEQRGSTTFVVTSGISGWAIPFKTGAKSEFVVIDISSI